MDPRIRASQSLALTRVLHIEMVREAAVRAACRTADTKAASYLSFPYLGRETSQILKLCKNREQYGTVREREEEESVVLKVYFTRCWRILQEKAIWGPSRAK